MKIATTSQQSALHIIWFSMITQSMQRLIFDIHFTKEKLVDGILDLRSIRSEDQIADEITKRPLNLDV